MSSLEGESTFTNTLLDEAIENYINFLFLNNSKIHFLVLQTKFFANSWMFYFCLLCCLFLIAIFSAVFSEFGLNKKGKIYTTQAL